MFFQVKTHLNPIKVFVSSHYKPSTCKTWIRLYTIVSKVKTSHAYCAIAKKEHLYFIDQVKIISQLLEFREKGYLLPKSQTGGFCSLHTDVSFPTKVEKLFSVFRLGILKHFIASLQMFANDYDSNYQKVQFHQCL